VQPRLAQLEPVGLEGHRLLAAQQRHDGVERLVHARALGHGLDPHHVGVGNERAGPAAEHGAAARHMVELHEPLGYQERVVIRQARHPRAEHDVPGALGGGADEDLGRGDQLPAGRVMLTDPHLVVAEVVQPLDQLHIAREGQRGILTKLVKRRQEDAELHSFVGHSPLVYPPAADRATSLLRTRSASTASQ
jgi:hypothetical protein